MTDVLLEPQGGARETGVKAVHLTLDILETISLAPNGLGVSELALTLGFTKSSIFRHLQTLVDRGYLLQNPDTFRYMLGLRAASLGRMAAKEADLEVAAQGPMRQLRDEVGQTVTLVVIDAKSLLVVDRLLGFDMLEISVRPGSILPLHATSHGKIAMAFSRQPLMELARSRPLERLTPFTVTNWEQLEEQIALIRRQGWSSSPQEIMLGINALSAPIFDRTGDCIAALAIVGSIQYVPPEPPPQQLAALLNAVRSISMQLGFNPPSR